MTGDRDLVVLLHGFGGFPLMMAPLARALRRAGYDCWLPAYRSRFGSLDAIVARLDRQLAARVGDDEARRVHFVTHSMGGLVARALIARARPHRLGHVVMLGPPHGGSEWIDLARRLGAARLVLGPAEGLLARDRDDALAGALGRIDYPLGIVAGDAPLDAALSDRIMPRPHDGKVSVEATRVEGMTDHVVLPVSHVMLTADRRVAAAVLHFLEHGRFGAG